MVQPSAGGFSQKDREELNDEKIIGCPSRSTREAIMLQPDAGAGFAVIFGEVAWSSEASWKTSIAHGASEYLGNRPYGTETASLAIVTAPVTWVLRTWLGLHTVIP
jgi:hypothetical protein